MRPEGSLAQARLCQRPGRRTFRRRRGVVTLWTIIAVPVLLAMLCVVVEVAHLWKARVELENSLEAAALASVQSWGEGAVSPTLTYRQIGVAYAAANTINGTPVSIGTNFSAGADANDNASCDGNLVFGRVSDLDGDGRWEFDAGERPSCTPGTVLFDASEQGGLNADNAWGISFLNPSNLPGYTDLRISQIVIDLQASGGSGVFDLTPAAYPALSSNVSPYAVRTSGGAAEQPDIAGFAIPSSQITFSPTTGTPSTLTITFSAAGGDDGFAPCDRFRFGARVENVSGGTGGDDGDGIGQDGVGVTVTFVNSSGDFIGTASAIFDDTRETACASTAATDTHCGSLIVNTGANLPDLPCPPANAAGNNGQSWVLLQGSGSTGFYGVHAQASVTVPALCANFCGLPVSPFRVMADTFALYECGGTNSPRLIRVLDANYTCP